ncbi:MAG: glycosyltransferase [Acidobacteriota bacterium]
MARVLMVSTIAGTHRSFLLPLARHFRKKGWRIDAAAAGISKSSECREAYERVFELNWSRHPLDLGHLISSARRIRFLATSESYDIVHVHTPLAAFAVRFALRRLRRGGRPKVVYTAHGFHSHPEGNPFSNAFFLGLEKMAGRWTDRLIVINRHDETVAEKKKIVPSAHLAYMPGIGVDRAYYSPDRVSPEGIAKVRKDMGIGDGTPLFLMIGDFMPGKRHQDLIRAFRGVRRDAHLAFAGIGNRSRKMKKLVRELGLEDRVHFLGLRNDIPVLIRSSVATIMPSIREGLSRSVIESLCLGVPVIGTDIRGIRDILEPAGGLLVPPRCPAALQSRMEWVLSHPKEAEDLGLRGRETSTIYDVNRIIALHEELYSGLISCA